ncbi:MAG: hypothetical protein QXR84_06225 [Candidatus Bathyarchaeia archaeon]
MTQPATLPKPDELRVKLLKQGARRVKLTGGRWYWNLMPSHGQGEKIAAT